MKLVYYPDPILTTKCEPVTVFDENLGKTLDEMLNIMRDNHGMGLAAPQVGISQAFFIMQDNKGKIWEFINPQIIDEDGAQLKQEGCLSFPGIWLQIPRPAYVTMKAQDRNGNEFTVMAEEMEAVCLVHEYQHICGIIYLTQASRQQRRAAEAILRKKK